MRRRIREIASRLAVFGTCRRCTRQSGIAAGVAVALAALEFALHGPSPVALCVSAAAASLCALYLAHRIASGRRRSPVIHLLKIFGADAREARTIVGAFPEGADFAELRAGHLRPGESLDVTRVPLSAGFRISRVRVTRGEDVLTEVVRRDDGRFTAVDIARRHPIASR